MQNPWTPQSGSQPEPESIPASVPPSIPQHSVPSPQQPVGQHITPQQAPGHPELKRQPMLGSQ